MVIKSADISILKMSTNPPQCVVDADWCVICDGYVSQWVGIGWITLRQAAPTDYDNIPQVPTPHCSQCRHYDCLSNNTMYCNKHQKRITARKRPCKYYIEL